MSEEPKPVRCGCGGEAFYVGTKDIGYVYCDKCETETKNYETRAEAVEAWNRAMGERTAKVLYGSIYYTDNGEKVIDPAVRCENCKTKINFHMNKLKYCPECGARLEWK